MKIIFLLEESSMKIYLDQILPKILPDNIQFQTIKHRGKSDLVKSIPLKLKGWNEPGEIRFVVVYDKDSSDCVQLKTQLQELCDSCRPGVLVRIPCQELEAWYWGDLSAVSAALGKDITSYSQKSQYRNPDLIVNPKEKLKKIFPLLQQESGARAIGREANINDNTSPSFHCFVEGIKRICNIK